MTRRALLAAGTAAGLAGCGGGEPRPGPRPRHRPSVPRATGTAASASDAQLLEPLVELKARAVALYRGRPGLERLRAHERVHLARLLEAAPGRPFHYRLRTSPIELELEQLAAQLAVLPRLSDPEMRTLIAGMYATDAEHLAVLRSAAGRNAAARAFVTGAA